MTTSLEPDTPRSGADPARAGSLPFAVFGAAGAQGAPVVDELLRRGHRVLAVGRDATAMQDRYGDRAQAASADLGDAAALQAVLRGARAAFVHIPLPKDPATPGRQLACFIAAARAVRLPLTVFTTSGSSGPRYPRAEFISANDQAVRALLESGLPAIVLRPTIYLENLSWPHLVEQVRNAGVLQYPPLPANRAVSWTSLRDQALAVAAALERPDLAGRICDIASRGAVTGEQLAVLLGRQVGRPVRYAPLTPQAFGEQLGQALGSTFLGQGIGGLYEALSGAGPDALVVDPEPAERELGVRFGSAAEHLQAWPA